MLDGNGKEVKANLPLNPNPNSTGADLNEKKASLADQMMSPYGSDGQIVNMAAPGQLNAIANNRSKQCNDLKYK